MFRLFSFNYPQATRAKLIVDLGKKKMIKKDLNFSPHKPTSASGSFGYLMTFQQKNIFHEMDALMESRLVEK